jgi:hypothetical protein
MDKGKVVLTGKTEAVINSYSASFNVNNIFTNDLTTNSKVYFFKSVKPLNREGSSTSSFAHDEEIILEITFVAKQDLRNTHILVSVNNKNGQRIFSSDLKLDNCDVKLDGENVFYLTIPKVTLAPGNYSFFAAIHCPNTIGYDVVDNICPISVFDNGSNFIQYEGRWFYGDVFVSSAWKFKSK